MSEYRLEIVKGPACDLASAEPDWAYYAHVYDGNGVMVYSGTGAAGENGRAHCEQTGKEMLEYHQRRDVARRQMG